MQLKISRKILITILTSLFLVLLSTGLYFFFKQDLIKLKTPKLDKYTDIINWCEYTNNNEVFNVECKALLLNITNDENRNSCFDMLVISNGKELKNLTVCEANNNITYTNEVLEYKKLMPINISFNYSRKEILNDYVFSNVFIETIDEEYIHNIVNEDIANLVQTDVGSVTTIKNSVNFCPLPSSLPSYIKEDNKISYENYYTLALNQNGYEDGSLFSPENKELQLIFVCKSEIISGFKKTCNLSEIEITKDMESSFQIFPNGIQFHNYFEEIDNRFLNEFTLIMDGQNYFKIYNPSDVVTSLLNYLSNSQEIDEQLFCGSYIFLNNIDSISTNIPAKEYLAYMRNYINNNVEKLSSGLCLDAIDYSKIDNHGLYINNSINSSHNGDIFRLASLCLNLENLVSE